MHIEILAPTDNHADPLEDVREGRWLLDRLAAAIDDVENLKADLLRLLARMERSTAPIARGRTPKTADDR